MLNIMDIASTQTQSVVEGARRSQNEIYNVNNNQTIKKFLLEKKHQPSATIRICCIFLLLYLTKLSLDEVLDFKVGELKELIEHNCCVVSLNKKYLIRLSEDEDSLNLKEFGFLYYESIRGKSDDNYVFTVFTNHETKLRKNVIRNALNVMFLELENAHGLKLSLNELSSSVLYYTC